MRTAPTKGILAASWNFVWSTKQFNPIILASYNLLTYKISRIGFRRQRSKAEGRVPESIWYLDSELLFLILVPAGRTHQGTAKFDANVAGPVFPCLPQILDHVYPRVSLQSSRQFNRKRKNIGKKGVTHSLTRAHESIFILSGLILANYTFARDVQSLPKNLINLSISKTVLM